MHLSNRLFSVSLEITFKEQFKDSGHLLWNSHEEEEECSTLMAKNNPFIKKPLTKSDKYGKEVKIACCGCFPVSFNKNQDD